MEKLKIENLFARRSIRKFTSQPLSKDQIQDLLRAAMSAPSAGNRKPWHFVVVTEAATRNLIADIHPYGKMAREAPVVISVCGDPQLGYPGNPDFWVQDCSAATENILLAVQGMGLGAVWCGVYPNPERVEEFRKLLGLPLQIVPLNVIPIGYPAESKEPRTQYDEMRVHWDRW